jgi:hypothetical protein
LLRSQAALTRDGVVVISDIADTFGASKRAALLGAHLCGKHAPKAKTIQFEDGTSRTTLAAVTSGLSELDPMRLGDLPADDRVATAACSPQFEAAIADFRTTISQGTAPRTGKNVRGDTLHRRRHPHVTCFARRGSV